MAISSFDFCTNAGPAESISIMLHHLRATLVVAGLFGLVALPFVGVMLVLLAFGASSGLVIGLGFMTLLASLAIAVSQRGQAFLGDNMRRATRRG